MLSYGLRDNLSIHFNAYSWPAQWLLNPFGERLICSGMMGSWSSSSKSRSLKPNEVSRVDIRLSIFKSEVAIEYSTASLIDSLKSISSFTRSITNLFRAFLNSGFANKILCLQVQRVAQERRVQGS